VKLVLIALVLCLTVGGQDMPGVVVFPPCAASSHAHQASDIRIALIRIREVTKCGFTYEDLEQNSVEIQPITSTDEKLFQLAGVRFGSKLVKVSLLCEAIRKGGFGILAYCETCRAGFLMRATPDVKD